jgi:hypothetical protein
MVTTAGFPPELRSVAGGLSANIGRGGAVLAPFLAYLDGRTAILICAAASFLTAGACVLFKHNPYLALVSEEVQQNSGTRGRNVQT